MRCFVWDDSVVHRVLKTSSYLLISHLIYFDIYIACLKLVHNTLECLMTGWFKRLKVGSHFHILLRNSHLCTLYIPNVQ